MQGVAQSEAAGETESEAALSRPVEAAADDEGVDARPGAPASEFGDEAAEAEEPVARPVATDPVPDPAQQPVFDAFNDSTWNFAPTGRPWYRTGPAPAVISAAAVAVVALVISSVLLIVGDSARHVPAAHTTPPSASSSAPSVATMTPSATAAEVPAGSVAPPPNPTLTAETLAPRASARPATSTPSRKPELNVTRPPISVAPARPAR
jgi:hypothetical protein